MNFTREQVQAAQRTVYAAMPPTPQYAWPLLQQRLGFKVYVLDRPEQIQQILEDMANGEPTNGSRVDRA